MNQKKSEKALEFIAQRENLSVDEVIDQIALVISYTIKSKDPDLCNFWKKFPEADKDMDIDEIISLLAQYYAQDVLGWNHSLDC